MKQVNITPTIWHLDAVPCLYCGRAGVCAHIVFHKHFPDLGWRELIMAACSCYDCHRLFFVPVDRREQPITLDRAEYLDDNSWFANAVPESTWQDLHVEIAAIWKVGPPPTAGREKG